jgi:hypothetical protein
MEINLRGMWIWGKSTGGGGRIFGFLIVDFRFGEDEYRE